ncbi:hypothetical protein L0337_46295 [candidate division KSB1 bacterium]|nr:hypothetical protein [candidate division KSB1 bacterium]
MKIFSYKQGELIAEAFERWEVEYLFIGSSGSIFYGFPAVIQGIEIFPAKTPENGQKLISALRELGFELTPEDESHLIAGKDFVQLRSGPFDLDLVFAPDGIETFTEAKSRALMIDGRFPVASLDDIIASKRAANRQKDRESLPRLEAFRDYLRSRNLTALPANPSNP